MVVVVASAVIFGTHLVVVVDAPRWRTALLPGLRTKRPLGQKEARRLGI